MALANLERDGHGYLVDLNAWNRDIATELAEEEGVNLTDESFKLIDFLREEYINNNANQPNERNMVKGLKNDWDGKLTLSAFFVKSLNFSNHLCVSFQVILRFFLLV
jgi:tRNA 2-thiouridine synthesizing protein E